MANTTQNPTRTSHLLALMKKGDDAFNSRDFGAMKAAHHPKMIAHMPGSPEPIRGDGPFPDSRFKAGARTFPELAMVEPEMEGVAEAMAAVKFWAEEWTGKSFMAIGAKAPDMDEMQTLRSQIRGCPDPLMVTEADHFVPEWGESVARAALRSFGDFK